jgi:hypothetical protein
MTVAAAISTTLPARKPVMKLSDILHELQQDRADR